MARETDPGKRIVFTGLGAITPLALDVPTSWAKALAGESGVRFVGDKYSPNVQIAGEVQNFNASRFYLPKDERGIPRFGLLPSVAAVEAGEDAKSVKTTPQMQRNKQEILIPELVDFDPDEVGAEVGTAYGGGPYCGEVEYRLTNNLPIRSFSIDHINCNRSSDTVHLLLGIRGTGASPAAACASSNSAVVSAARAIKLGDARAMFAGAADAFPGRWGIRSFEAMGIGGALSKRNNEPEKASRPFDKDRDGFVMAEGAAIMFMESLESALKRDVHIYGELIGWGDNSYPDNGALPSLEGEIKAIRKALEMGEIEPEQVDYINAHAAGTVGDITERKAIKTVFGNRNTLVISATKSLIGHSMGPASGIGMIFTLLSMRDGKIHPTINLDKEAPLDEGEPDFSLNFVPHVAQDHKVNYALVHGFGLGGKNTILLLRNYNALEGKIAA